MKKIHKIILTLIIVVLAGAGIFFFVNKGGDQSAVFEISSYDTIDSWDFEGLYVNNSELVAKTNESIERLKNLTPGEDNGYNDYMYNIELSNYYYYLGDGKNAYKYLLKALETDSTNTGLAYANMANLMKELGALNTAKENYKKAYEIQPNKFYQDKYVMFMQEYYPAELQSILDAETKTATTTESLSTEQ